MSTTHDVRTETDEGSTVTEFLAAHPRLIGAVFLTLLVLTQAGQVAAGTTSSIAGP